MVLLFGLFLLANGRSFVSMAFCLVFIFGAWKHEPKQMIRRIERFLFLSLLFGFRFYGHLLKKYVDQTERAMHVIFP